MVEFQRRSTLTVPAGLLATGVRGGPQRLLLAAKLF